MSKKEKKSLIKIISIFMIIIIALGVGLGMLLIQRNETKQFIEVSLKSYDLFKNLFKKILLTEKAKGDFLLKSLNGDLVNLYTNPQFRHYYLSPIFDQINEIEKFKKINEKYLQEKEIYFFDTLIKNGQQYNANIVVSFNSASYNAGKIGIDQAFTNLLNNSQEVELFQNKLLIKKKTELLNRQTIAILIFICFMVITVIIGILFSRSLLSTIRQQEEIITARATLEVAERIQTAALPDSIIENELFEVSTWMQTADEVGGDYYEVILNKNSNTWINIGDVCGHGIDASLAMLFIQAASLSAIEQDPDGSTEKLIVSINNAFTKFNERLKRKKIDTKYITLTTIKINNESLEMEYTGAHQDILVYRNNSITSLETKESSFWPGILKEKDYLKSVSSKTFQLQQGDTVLLYTDGITEAWTGKNKEKFYDKNLIDTFLKNGNKAPKEIIEEIKLSLNSYKTDDDQSIVCFTVRGGVK